MGTIQNDAVIVTVYETKAQPIRDWVATQTPEVQTLFAEVGTLANGCVTFFMGPDGSKEGWEPSDTGDTVRKEFVSLLENEEDAVQVSYGEYGIAIERRGNRLQAFH